MKQRSAFSSNFVSPFSVMRHNSSLVSQLNLHMLWTKTGQQSTNFQTFDCSHENQPNFLSHFFSHESAFLKILHQPSLPWHIISLRFPSLDIIYYGQKESISVQFFRLLSALMKVHPIAHAMIETTRSWPIQILRHCSVSWKITSLYDFSENLIYFLQV